MSHTLGLAIAGFISGILSFFISFYLPLPLLGESVWNLFLAPGLVFGVVVAYYFFTLNKIQTSPKRRLLWLITSIISYYIAVWVTIYSSPRALEMNAPIDISFMIGGLVGSFLMLNGFSFLLYRLNKIQLLTLTILGGILSLGFYIIPDRLFFKTDSWFSPPYERIFGLVLIWQTGMAAALGWVMDKSKLPSRK